MSQSIAASSSGAIQWRIMRRNCSGEPRAGRKSRITVAMPVSVWPIICALKPSSRKPNSLPTSRILRQSSCARPLSVRIMNS